MKKINWGTGIFIAFALFMSFILFFVFLVQSDHKYDNELVIEDYYKYETGLQAQLDKEDNASKLEQKVSFEAGENGIIITFPKGFDYKNITGKVSLYRPSSQKLDFEIPIALSSSNLLIPKSDLAGGRWDIVTDWNYNGTGYINKKQLTLD
ncbi:FixH family protein [Flavobacterium microcysteis]|uniref:Cytochrome C oxidase Cbb3 n=1 Tax=Flavobacterium microcysteis TaxID=2596891 RepID=A0A501QHA4_9FLAO|nr:FixH family protein [Flavobacterium microcysteis]TPD72279.1 cytochrome C oxidase Cbb3 [Flavobacterium microcysteis]